MTAGLGVTAPKHMKRIGTIDRPHTHDPRNQAEMSVPTHEPVGSATPNVTIIGANDSRQNRTREMQLIPEALARAHMHDRLRRPTCSGRPCAWSMRAGCSAGPSAPRCAPAGRWPWQSCTSQAELQQPPLPGSRSLPGSDQYP